MRLDNIDEIIKKGFKESERQNDFFVNMSKPGIWNAIEKPKKQKSQPWGFVTAMAASVSLFLISVLLIWKLDSTQKELDAVQAQINREILPSQSPVDFSITDEIPPARWDIKSEGMPGPMPTDKKVQIPGQVQDPTLTAFAKEKSNSREVHPIPIIEKKIMDFNPAITLPEFDPLELNEGLVLPKNLDYTIPSSTKFNKKGKLKIRIGNGSPDYNHHQSLALNFKI
jgi:hypothetical protein